MLQDELHEYATLANGVVAGLRIAIGGRGDDQTSEAIDTIGRHADALLAASVRSECDLIELVGLIHESRRAWQSLARPTHAVANGVPAAMIARLEALARVRPVRLC